MRPNLRPTGVSAPMSHPTRRRPRTSSRGPSRPAPRPAAKAPSALELAFAAAEAAAPPPHRTFAAMGLPQGLVTALERRDIREPFAIQSRTLPDALAGRDVLGRAQTGSGKTLAFGLPMLARLIGTRRTNGAPQGLVLVPTRELANQVAEALAPLGQAVGLRIATVYGGASMSRQITALRRGVDIVIATPGRLLDLIGQGECSLQLVTITVVDEADYMADLGFLPVVTEILGQTALGGQRLLFSATLDNGVDRLVHRFLTDPATHAVAPAISQVANMDHRAFTVQAGDKVSVATQIAARDGRSLFFVRTKHGAERLAKQLRTAGVDAGALHGNLAQNARQRTLNAFAAGTSPVLVATDVAARGIHVDDIDLVVHFDPPADHKDYLHRSGRTARAGASGLVLSLLLPEQQRDAARLHGQAGVTPTAVFVRPGHDEVRKLADSGTPVVITAPPLPTSASTSSERPRNSSRQGGYPRNNSRQPGYSRGRPQRSSSGRPAPARSA
ncbi:MAG: DEAD/DEAH box helicase [Pseudonocardiales bacterium]|nr:MAG: DEAD/DEAH box helicase [Pseudonocardiales bacterium]